MKVIEDSFLYMNRVCGMSASDFCLYFTGESEGLAEFEEFAMERIKKYLEEQGVSSEEVLAIRDTLNRLVQESYVKRSKSFVRSNEFTESRDTGEYYTPLAMAKFARECMAEEFPDVWGKEVLWDASAGTGNLMNGGGYDETKMFLSTLQESDIPILQGVFPDATAFQLDFLNKMDFDRDNRDFLSQLPEELQSVFLEDKPLIFYMNPPYLVSSMETDMRAKMRHLGYGGASVDLFFQFLFRITELVRTFDLSDVRVAVFSPISMFSSTQYRPFMEYFCEYFEFVRGYSFASIGTFDTSKSSNWLGAFSMWRLGSCNFADVRLQAHQTDSEYSLVRGGRELLSSWASPKEVTELISFPASSSGLKQSDSWSKAPKGAFAWLFSSDWGGKATRMNSFITLVGNNTCIPVMGSNFKRACVSKVVRKCASMEKNAFNLNQHFLAPYEGVEETEEFGIWSNHCVILAMLSPYSSSVAFYDSDGALYRNTMFPVGISMLAESIAEVEGIVTDGVDEDYCSVGGMLFARSIVSLGDKMLPEAGDLIAGYLDVIRGSYALRAEHGFPNNSEQWDAGFIQYRDLLKRYDRDSYRRLVSLWNALRDKLAYGVYEFGFLNRVVE